jgi:hypothetical protein
MQRLLTLLTGTAVAAAPVTLVHLTDVHVDPYYVTGAATPGCFCETHETCARFPASCVVTPDAAGAGPFGDSDADCATPPALWGSAMGELSAPATAGAQFAFFTGDFGSAGLSASCGGDGPRATTQILDVVSRGMAAARAALPSARVFGVFGNHDTAPGDSFGNSAEMAWLYGPLADGAFGADLNGDAAALATLRAGGWYTTDLTATTALVALNTNYFGSFNPDSEATAMGELEFAWLNSTLAALAAANRSALVIGHIPPKDGFWRGGLFSRYRAILTAYPVVLAAFFGHDHLDEFQIVRSCVPPSPAPQPPSNGPYDGPWLVTRGISWCSGGNYDVGDVWGRGTEPGSPHCPYLPPTNGTEEGSVALCEGLCGNATACRGFTRYPDDGSTFGACCFRTSCVDKPPNANSSAVCYEKVAPEGPCDGGPQDPLHVLYVAPSLTEGYPPSNPGLRYYTLDSDRLAPLDTTTLWMNLSAANAAWAPRWQVEYSARAAYGLEDASAGSWARALARMAVDGAPEWAAFVNASRKQFAGTAVCEGTCKAAWIGYMNGSAADA